jgi:hypothetical protein
MARTYLVFGDIDGKLDVLRVECALPTEGPLQRPQANRKIRTQRQHDEMEGAAQRRLPQAGRASNARSLRSDLSRSPEGALITGRLRPDDSRPFSLLLQRVDSAVDAAISDRVD